MAGETQEEKIAKLPAWARELIRDLRTRNEPAAEEIAQLRRKVESLQRDNRRKQDRIDAMVEMFQCAAKGGSEVAVAVARIVEDFLISAGE
jgi:hypothetical protein